MLGLLGLMGFLGLSDFSGLKVHEIQETQKTQETLENQNTHERQETHEAHDTQETQQYQLITYGRVDDLHRRQSCKISFLFLSWVSATYFILDNVNSFQIDPQTFSTSVLGMNIR